MQTASNPFSGAATGEDSSRTDAVGGALEPAPWAGRTVLISAGPTHEPIDPVRYLGNRSSGKMGFALAAEAVARGARTQLVSGPVSLPTPEGAERTDVTTALEMRDAVNARAARADLIIMTAAVADFRPLITSQSKIKKELGAPRIELVANPDILAGLPEVAPGALRVGFAAETEVSEDEAYAKLERKGSHFLVWNDVSQAGLGFGADDNEVTVYSHGAPPLRIDRRPKEAIARALFDLFAQALENRGTEVASVAL